MDGSVDDAPRGEVHHEEVVTLRAAGIDGVREEAVVAADFTRATVKIGVALRQLVLIEDNLLGSGDWIAVAAAEYLVLAAFFGARVVVKLPRATGTDASVSSMRPTIST
jgi:hypothetical protein